MDTALSWIILMCKLLTCRIKSWRFMPTYWAINPTFMLVCTCMWKYSTQWSNLEQWRWHDLGRGGVGPVRERDSRKLMYELPHHHTFCVHRQQGQTFFFFFFFLVLCFFFFYVWKQGLIRTRYPPRALLIWTPSTTHAQLKSVLKSIMGKPTYHMHQKMIKPQSSFYWKAE